MKGRSTGRPSTAGRACRNEGSRGGCLQSPLKCTGGGGPPVAAILKSQLSSHGPPITAMLLGLRPPSLSPLAPSPFLPHLLLPIAAMLLSPWPSYRNDAPIAAVFAGAKSLSLSLSLSLALALSLSLSLSLSHTHTHTLSLTHSLWLSWSSQEQPDRSLSHRTRKIQTRGVAGGGPCGICWLYLCQA